MNKLSPHNRKAVLLAAACAGMSGGSILLRGHRILLGVWIAVQFVFLIAAILQLNLAKKAPR